MRLLVCMLMLWCSVGILSAQEKAPINGWEIKKDPPQDFKRKKQFIKEELDKFDAQTSKYYNIPQGRFYIGLKAGYGLPFLTVNRRNIEDFFGINDYFESVDGTKLNRTVVTTDAGGPRYGAYMGVRFNQFISMELDVSFNYYNSVLQGRYDSPHYYSELFTRTRDVSLNPQFVITTPNLKNFQLFGKFGLYFPAWVKATGNTIVNDQEGRWLKSILGVPGEGYADLLDVVAELLSEEVDGLGFLDEGFFNAIGYNMNLEAEVDIDFQPNIDNLGYTGGLGVMYHVSPLISLVAEAKGSGYNISTKGYQLELGELSLDLFGNRNVLVINKDGGLIDGETVIPKEDLAWLFEVNHTKEITEESNNILYNPETFDITKPSEKLSIRKSVFAMVFSVSVHINFDRKNKRNKNEEVN